MVTEEKSISKAGNVVSNRTETVSPKNDGLYTPAMDPLSLASTLTVPLRFVLGLAGGVVAVLVMDAVMARLPEGGTPPFVASGVLTESRPDEAPARLATVVHYLAGLLTGPLFVWLLLTSEALFGGLSLPATLVAAAVLYVLMVGFFVVVVLPQSRVADDRVATIRRDWALSALSYLVVLVPVVGLGSRLLPAV
jgi:hypothetical protein